jgi:hypothetical protein
MTFVEMAGDERTLRSIKNNLLQQVLAKGHLELSASGGGKPLKINLGDGSISGVR